MYQLKNIQANEEPAAFISWPNSLQYQYLTAYGTEATYRNIISNNQRKELRTQKLHIFSIINIYVIVKVSFRS